MFQESGLDIILTPTTASAPPVIGYLDMNLPFETLFERIQQWACFTAYHNAAGAPSISLPVQYYTEEDLPMGMMLSANLGQEALLLDIAYQLEVANPWKKITDWRTSETQAADGLDFFSSNYWATLKRLVPIKQIAICGVRFNNLAA